MYIQIVNFNMAISEEEFDQVVIKGAPIFAKVEGLIVGLTQLSAKSCMMARLIFE